MTARKTIRRKRYTNHIAVLAGRIKRVRKRRWRKAEPAAKKEGD